MSAFNGLYNIRDGVAEDNNFILATFLRGLYYGDSWFSSIPKDIFMKEYKKVAQVLVDKSRTNVKIACLKEDPNVILGYSISSKDSTILHFIFVKSIWRKRGIARSLIPHLPKAVTHLTKLGQKLMTKLPNTIFNPFATHP